MNVRDPFGLHRNPTFGILRATANQAAREIKHRAIEAGAHALERGKQAREAVETAVETALESASAVTDDMAFSVPRNVPSFNNPQRIAEDQLWGAATGKTNTGNRGGRNNILDAVGGLFESGIPGRSSQTLPMYKDKPYGYLPSERARPVYRRKRVLGLVFFVFLAALYYLGWFDAHKDRVPRVPLPSWDWLNGKDEKAHSRADWLDRRERVVEAFELSWDAYERYAWGYDEFHPDSKLGKQMAPHGLGWIIIDSLDTLMLMNLTSRLVHAREWVANKLTWDQDQDINTFETTIRMMGGLLSAHYLANEYPHLAKLNDIQLAETGGEDLYLEKARDLADRLLSAFDSPTGVPWSSVNIGKSEAIAAHDNGGAASTAETTTLQLEFKYLAKLTGEKVFWDKVENVMAIVDQKSRQFDSLVPIYIDPLTGSFKGHNIRLGSRGDSYYEYLIKQYLQTNMKETVYLDMWTDALAAVRKHLVTYTETSHYTIIGERADGLEEPLTAKMDHLVCFMPGTIALAATRGMPLREARKSSWWTRQHDKDMKLAHELTQTCWGMYKYMATGLAAEITHFEIANPPPPESWQHQAPPSDFSPDPDAPWRKDFIVKSPDSHNLQRPETVESLFYMWRITGDIRYREWGWEMFKSFMAYTAVKDGGGFTSLSNANKLPPVSRDNMESFWLAETLKYFYLLFSPDDLLPLDKIVINTEAHPFPRFDMGPLFSTGWTRQPAAASAGAP
ncbi:mannosyl-oligosaccharide alpha-1,2-mannosidase [Grosmannia clavigera kw1407]|uniref:alpha-1,2-Mannosidase n=1 Tax=Grosmannia clavigera (strain kw1407 / UAMH 11150) TaxID=655863 RepID=F0XLJ3_GROCL|nr:mannosyl-oligosaccharide alpha-1,2-mannosidase [Grosmannia clavigera kw1407]EFX01449.1 mannosyl-oligosaccharide alpha-1,2-mannosidase [Grosmannia clavigera kw1407]